MALLGDLKFHDLIVEGAHQLIGDYVVHVARVVRILLGPLMGFGRGLKATGQLRKAGAKPALCHEP